MLQHSVVWLTPRREERTSTLHFTNAIAFQGLRVTKSPLALLARLSFGGMERLGAMELGKR
jgi:hypothetical protein